MLKRLIEGLPLGLGILGIVIALIAFLVAQNANEQAKRTVQRLDDNLEQVERISPDGALARAASLEREAKRALEKAESAAGTADIILGFIEGGFTILTVLLALGTLSFGLSIRDVRERVDNAVEEAQGMLTTSENQVKDLQKQMRLQLDEAVRSDEERLEESRQQFAELEARMRLQLEEAERADNERLKESQAQFAELTSEIEGALGRTEEKLSNFEELINNAVGEAQEQAANAFRALSLLLLAEQQVRAHNRETAIVTLEEALPLDPENQTTNYLLGYLYVGRKEFSKAITHLEQALSINPKFAPALAAMGLAQSRMGDQEEDEMKRNQLRAQAEFNLTKALETDPGLLDPDDESYFGTLGGLYRRQKREESALMAYEHAVNVTPNNSYPVSNLAILAKKFGREEQAQEMFSRVVKIADAVLDDQPSNIWTRFDRAQAYLVIGEEKRAIQDYTLVFEMIDSPGPLESALSGLRFLEDVPDPPRGLGKVIALMQAEIDRLQP